MQPLEYPQTLMSCMFFLAMWTFFDRRSNYGIVWRSVLLIALAVYGIVWAMDSSAVGEKLGRLVQDLFILGFTGLVFLWLSNSTYSFIIGMVAMVGGFIGFYDKFSKAIISPPLVSQNEILLDPAAELLVEVKQGVNPNFIGNLNGVVQFYAAFTPEDGNSTDLDDYVVVDVENGQLDMVIKQLEDLEYVDWVEENEQLQMKLPETDGNAASIQSEFNDPMSNRQWAIQVLDLEGLHDYLKRANIKPKKIAKVAILDTGVDANHEDLRGNFFSIHNRHNRDDNKHGTHCAGIAGAVTNNQIGIASAIPNNKFVQITSVKVMNGNGMGTQKGIIGGIILAADQKVDVISLSLGGPSTRAKQLAYEKAVSYAINKGAIVVAAAGNAAMNAKRYAPVNTPGIIGVSAIDVDLRKATFSNTVIELERGVAAPGVGIWSTVPGNRYEALNGTSMATPFVSGLIGLMRSIDPDIPAEDVFQLLMTTGKRTSDPDNTGQLIQPYEAVRVLNESLVPAQ